MTNAIKNITDAVTAYVDLNHDWDRAGIKAIIKRELEKAVPARDTSNDLCLQYRSAWDRNVGFNQCRQAMGLGGE